MIFALIVEKNKNKCAKITILIDVSTVINMIVRSVVGHFGGDFCTLG